MLLMTDLVKIHPDILLALNKLNDDSFKTSTIRDFLMQLSPRYKNLDTVRLFASRHLSDLTEKGVLVCTGVRHSKRFTKCDGFHLIRFKPKGGRKTIVEHKKETVLISDFCIRELRAQKATMEAELSIKLAETEQYQLMIEQFPETASLALKLHSEAKEKAASIMGKIRAITNILSHQ